MKNFIYILFVIITLFCAQNTFAQNDFDKAKLLMAKSMCECLQPAIATMCPNTKAIINKMADFNSAEEVSNYIAQLPREKQDKVKSAMQQVQAYRNSENFNTCGKDVAIQMMDYMDGLQARSTDDFLKAFSNEMKNIEDCKTAYFFIKFDNIK